MTIMLAIQQELAELRVENAKIKRRLESNEEESDGDQECPSKTHVTSPPTNAETVEESARKTHPPGEGIVNTLALRRGGRKHPFVDGITETPLPRGWKSLTMDRYDGTTNPDDHVHVYLTQIGFYTSDNAIFCKVFPTSLKCATLSWFTHLAPFSIDCFDTLLDQF